MASTKPHRKAVSPRASGSKSKKKGVSSAPGTMPNHALVATLAARLLQSPESPDAPLIVVNHISQTSSVHVLAIWSKWKSLTIPQRSRVIADAYAAAFPGANMVVRLPMGLTPGEALSQGYLRYLIVPLVRPADKVSTKQVNDAMDSAGGIVMRIGDERRLRFATLEQAQEGYRRLLAKLNKPIWALSEESSVSDEGE